MKELSQDNLANEISSHQQVVVQYGASWCGACRMVKPKFGQLSESHSDIEFIYVDAEKYPESRQLAQVNNLPTFAAFKNGQLVGQNAGSNIGVVETLVQELKGGGQ